jgi:hypothetical protein
MGDGRFLFEQRVRRFTGFRRIDEEVYPDLTGDGWAEGDTRHLVDLIDDVLFDIDEFKVTPTSPAFPTDSLAERVKGDEFDAFGLDGRVRVGFHLPEDLFKRDKGFRLGVVDVGLIHFVGHEDESLIVTNPNDLLHIGFLETSAGRITRVDHDQRLDRGLASIDGIDGRLEYRLGQGPTGRFLQLIRHRVAGQGGQGGGVQRVLGDRDQDAITWGKSDVHDLGNTGTGPGRQEDHFRVRRVTIPTSDEFGHAFTDLFDPLAMGVGADATDLAVEFSSSGEGVLGVDLGG